MAKNEVEIPLLRTTTLHVFHLQVEDLPDGGRKVSVFMPTGEVLVLPIGKDAAQLLGQRLLAPSVEVASAVPGNGQPY